jgi:hypothetical protein
MSPRQYVLIIFLLAATGCSLLVNPMPGLWFFTYGTGTPGGKDSLHSAFHQLQNYLH